MEQSPSTPAEERHFYWLYAQMLDTIKNRERISDEAIGSGIDRIIDSFRYHLGHKFSDVDLERSSNICAYLFRYVPHFAGLVRCRVLEAARNCEALMYGLTRRPVLRVVSLGGGPGNALVGFCSALCELQFARISLKATVVDKIGRWSECVHQLGLLAMRTHCGNLSDVFRRNEVTLDFVRADVLGNSTTEDKICRLNVKNADVILVSKLMSTLRLSEKIHLVKKLQMTMSDEALIVFIDCPFEPFLWEQFDVLYLSEPDQHYQMSEVHERFGKDDAFKSKSRVAVLRKHLDVSEFLYDSD